MASRAHPGSLRSRVGDRQTHQPVAPARVAVARAPRARPSHQAVAAESVGVTVGAADNAPVGAAGGVGPTLARTEVSSGRTWFVVVGDAVTPMDGCGAGPGS